MQTPHIHCPACTISLAVPGRDDTAGSVFQCLCGVIIQGHHSGDGYLNHTWDGAQPHCASCHHVWGTIAAPAEPRTPAAKPNPRGGVAV